MAGNSNLASAMEAKQDEFYTQLRTIEYAATAISRRAMTDICGIDFLIVDGR